MGEDDVADLAMSTRDLEAYIESLRPQREEQHGDAALVSGYHSRIFNTSSHWVLREGRAKRMEGESHLRLDSWLRAMKSDTAMRELVVEDEDDGDVQMLDDSIDAGAGTVTAEDAITAPTVDPSILNEEQRRAYDIIVEHMLATKEGREVSQLLMQIQGEGGTGKSKVIELVTAAFRAHGVADWLRKGAFTGIAASLIDGKTLHALCMIALNGRKPGAYARRQLAAVWARVRYLIIDEVSMVSRDFHSGA